MVCKLTILTFFLLTFVFAYGQNVQVSKEIKIVKSFNYNSSKPVIEIDTIITEFVENGKLVEFASKSEKLFGRFIIIDSVILISEDNNIKHEREYRSDSTSAEIYTQNYPDSIVQVKLSKEDTIEIHKSYYNNKKLVKQYVRYFKENYDIDSKIYTFQVNTKKRVKKTVITTYNSRSIDTIKIDYKRINRTIKTLSYNPDKQEWYTKVKSRSRKYKLVSWETFYHDYHKRYFTMKYTVKYNKLGLKNLETIYNTHLKQFERKIIYEYEYY